VELEDVIARYDIATYDDCLEFMTR